MDLGLDETRRHAVDPNAVAGDLLGKTERQRVDAALGGGVPDVLARAADGRRARRQVDDRAAGAAALGRHAPHRRPGAVERAQQVDLDHPAQGLARGVLQAAGQAGRAGVVDQGGDRAERLLAGLEQGLDLVLARHVALHRERPAAGPGDRLHHVPGGAGVGLVVDADGIAPRRGQDRRGRADAAACAGHHQDSGHPPSNPLMRCLSAGSLARCPGRKRVPLRTFPAR